MIVNELRRLEWQQLVGECIGTLRDHRRVCVKVHLAVTILHSLASATDRPCETGEVSHVIWHHLQIQLEVCRQRYLEKPL